MTNALSRHWPEYVIEAAGLGLFMASAGLLGVLLYHPASPAVDAIADPNGRRVFMALAMGLTAIALIYSPWGQRSGAHFNPAVTLTFFRLGKVAGWDAGFYAVAQTAGGVIGIIVVAALLGGRLAHPAVRYVTTVPGVWGAGAAFAAEALISFALMSVVLTVSTTAAGGAASSAAGTRRDAACSSQSRGARRHPRCRGGLRPPAHAVPGAAGAGPYARARRGWRRYDRRRHGPRGGFLFQGALLREGVGRGGGR